MPTILRYEGYRFFFYSGDADEPYHVHIERENKIAKVWLEPIRLCYSSGFNRIEISKFLKIIDDKQVFMIEAWNEYFSSN